jgi:Gas vesicle protein K
MSVHEPLAGKVLSSQGDVTRALRGVGDVFPRRIDADPEKVERGLAQLVLTLVELLRQLMERQALRRMDAGALSEDEIERLGQTFMLLADRMEQLKAEFGLEDADLNLDLGPLGSLL